MHEKLRNSNSEQALPLHEWLVIFAILFIIATLTVLSLFNASPKLVNDKPHFIVPQELTITVEGAVAKPGTYTIKRGAIVEDAIALAEPLPNADLKKIKMSKKLHNNHRLKVPSQKKAKKSKNRLLAYTKKQF